MPYYYNYEKETISYDIENFMFSVGLHSIFFDKKRYNNSIKHRNLEDPVYAERFLAVVDEGRWNMLSCVSQSYNLITNKWALEKGHKVAQQVFHTSESGPYFRYGYLTKYRAACRMYLVIPKSLQIKNVNHKWYGLVEIVNSYDKSSSLEFNIGFSMETMNDSKIPLGLLIPSLSLHFSANHLWSWDTIERKLDDSITSEFRGRDVIMEFEKMVVRLLQIQVVDDEILPLFCKLAQIKKLDKNKENDIRLAYEYIRIEQSSRKWIENCGPNAYAALCAYADFVSNRPQNDSLLPEPTAFQSSLGRFVDELLEESKKEDFSLDDFIGKQAREVKKQIKLICTTVQH